MLRVPQPMPRDLSLLEMTDQIREAMSKFDKLVRELRKNPKVRNPEGLAAWIGGRKNRKTA